MRIKNWSLGYAFGYILVTIGMLSFYRKYKVVGRKNIPKNKPILFAGNHQSALMEGAILGYVTSTPIYFLGRSDIFKKPVAKFMLNSLNALPIYRERDGDDYRAKNDEVFELFYDLLSKRRPIVIFPEGNHGKHQQLRHLKKGVFRIAVGAEAKYNNELDVHIVPVGINYGKFENMGGDLLIQFGEPIAIKDYITNDTEQQEANYVELVKDLRRRLSAEMIDIQKMDHYDLIHDTMLVFDDELSLLTGESKTDLVSQFNRQKDYIAKAEQLIGTNVDEANRVRRVASEFKESLEKEGLKSWLFKKEKQATFVHVILMVLLFPLHIYGVINNYLPYRIPAWFVERKVNDVHFYASIKVFVGALLFIIFWSTQVVLVAVFTDNYIWAMYLASLFVSSFISYQYWISLLKLKGKLRYNKLQKQNDSAFKSLKNQYEELKTFVQKSYQK